MAQIKLTLSQRLVDGMDVKFKAPCDCTEVTGLLVSYVNDKGNTASKSFTFRDAHGNNLAGLGNLFASGAYVKAILDTVNGYAYIQNADTNKHIETGLNYSTLGKRTQIPSGADLDTYTTVGNYACNNMTIAASLKNSPFSNRVFTLDIKNCSGNDNLVPPTDSNTSYYILQTAESARGEKKFRRGYRESGAVVWDAWKKRLDSDSVVFWTTTVEVADWTQYSGYAHATPAMSGLLTTDMFMVDLNMPQSATIEVQQGYLDAWATIGKVQCVTSGQLRLTIFGEIPETALPIKVIAWRTT